MRICIPLPNEPPSAGVRVATPNRFGQRQRSMAEPPLAASLRPPWQERSWTWLLGHQLVSGVPELLDVLNAQDAQRLALQDMTHSEERFRQLVESADDVFWIYEPQRALFVYVSPAYEREWMRSAKALYADPHEWLGPVHGDDRQVLQQAFDLLAGGEGYTLEYRTTMKSGEQRWIAERAFPIASQSGQTARIAGVSQDITVRKNADLELRRSDRRKNELLAMVAHELRNPLQPIRSAAALLARKQSAGSAIEQKAVSIIERQVDHLTRLVDDLLDVARIDHGKIRLRSEVIRLQEVIDAATDANRMLAEESGVHFHVTLPSDDVWVLGDPQRLTQVFSNLLHNATKFSAANGIIELSVRRSAGDKQVAVSVRDEGTGIAPDLIDSVFELFTQEDQSPARDRGGLGIGLSVVRSLVELHGGKVSVRSDGLAKGSEFIVTLPTTGAPLAPAGSGPHLVKPADAATLMEALPG